MNTQQDMLVAGSGSLFSGVALQLRRSRMLAVAAALLAFGMSALVIALWGEPYSATAVVAPRASEARGLELGSLASLTELAGGGRRPIFEEFVYLLSSDAAARRLLSEKNELTERILKESAEQTNLRRAYYVVQNLMRAIAARESRHPSAFEDAVRKVRRSIETKKTPEGYVAITVSAGDQEEAKALLELAVNTSDDMIRTRERAAYSERVSVLLSMAEKSIRPTERAAIGNAIDRDFARYVSSLGSEAFSYQYVVSPRAEAQPRYVNGVLVLIACSIISAFALVTLTLLRVRLQR